MIVLTESKPYTTVSDVGRGYGSMIGGIVGGMGGRALGLMAVPFVPALQAQPSLAAYGGGLAGSVIGSKVGEKISNFITRKRKDERADFTKKSHRIGALLNGSDLDYKNVKSVNKLKEHLEKQQQYADEMGYGKVGQTVAKIPPISVGKYAPVALGMTNPKDVDHNKSNNM